MLLSSADTDCMNRTDRAHIAADDEDPSAMDINSRSPTSKPSFL